MEVRGNEALEGGRRVRAITGGVGEDGSTRGADNSNKHRFTGLNCRVCFWGMELNGLSDKVWKLPAGNEMTALYTMHTGTVPLCPF